MQKVAKALSLTRHQEKWRKEEENLRGKKRCWKWVFSKDSGTSGRRNLFIGSPKHLLSTAKCRNNRASFLPSGVFHFLGPSIANKHFLPLTSWSSFSLALSLAHPATPLAPPQSLSGFFSHSQPLDTVKHQDANLCLLYCSVTSDSLQPHELSPSWLFCPWDSPGSNIGVGCHFLLQGIFPNQGSNQHVLHFRQILYHWVTREVTPPSQPCITFFNIFTTYIINVWILYITHTWLYANISNVYVYLHK